MRKTILANISFNFLIRIFTYLFSFISLLYVTRVLQPEAFGRISFASSFASHFIIVANLGIPIYGMRTCAEKRKDRGELSKAFNELWSISILLSITSGIIFTITILSVSKLKESSLLLMIYGSAIFFQMIGCEWLLKGLEKFRFLAVTSFLCKLLSLVCIFLFVRSEQSVALYATLSVLTAYGSNIVCFCVLHRHVDISFSFRINRAHFKPLLIFFMMSLAVSVYSSLDLTILGFMKTEYETGLYSLAAQGINVLKLTGGIVWSTILPMSTELWKEGKKGRFESLASRSLVAVCSIQTVLAIVCMILAGFIILILGGPSYLDASMAFRILLLSLLPVGASNILGGQVLIPAGKEIRLLEAEIAGAVFNFFANLILIPMFSIEGAALTTVISEIIVWIHCVYFIKKDLHMDFGVGIVKKTCRWGVRILKTKILRAKSRISGNRLPYYCSCCDTHLMQFINGAYEKFPKSYNFARYEGRDQRVICPICHSLPRHRILVSWMDENIDWIRDKTILHFAQEKSVRMWMDRHGIVSITADLYNPADLQINIEETRLDSDSYDMIICNHVLEHVSDYKKALSELYRILRPGGKLVISFPVDLTLDSVYEDADIQSEQDRILHFGQKDHLRVFGKDSPEMLESYGFEVTEIRGEQYDERIKPIIGPADYDYNVLWCLEKKESPEIPG